MLPVTGDWDGNGTASIGVFRNGIWYLRNTNTPGGVDSVFAYGSAGDVPLTGEWELVSTKVPAPAPRLSPGIAIHRGASWYLRDAITSGLPERTISWSALTTSR